MLNKQSLHNYKVGLNVESIYYCWCSRDWNRAVHVAVCLNLYGLCCQTASQRLVFSSGWGWLWQGWCSNPIPNCWKYLEIMILSFWIILVDPWQSMQFMLHIHFDYHDINAFQIQLREALKVTLWGTNLNSSK